MGKSAAQQDLYGFVFNSEGVCVAHGASQGFVGKVCFC